MISDGQYWKKRGVASVGRYATLWERFVTRLPPHKLDGRVYDKFKGSKKSCVGFVEFGQPVLIVLEPDYMRNIFVKDFDYFVNRRSVRIPGDEYFNKTLLMMEGDEWKGLRATLSPTFTTSKIRAMFSIFNESGNSLVKFLKNRDMDQELEINDPMGRYTMDVISSAAFGFDSKNFENKDSPFAKMGIKFQAGFRGYAVFKILLVVLIPWISKFLKITIFDKIATTFLVDVIKKNIKYREDVGEKRNDFLQLLIDTKAGSLKQEDGILDNFEKEAKLSANQKKVQLTDDLIYAQSIMYVICNILIISIK